MGNIIICDDNPFEKDVKRLIKRFRKIKEDLGTFKKIIYKYPKGNDPQKFRLVRSPSGQSYPSEVKIIKAYVESRDIGGKPPYRVIYAYWDTLSQIDLIELYFKGDKTNNNPKIISDYLKRCKNQPLGIKHDRRQSIR